MNYRSHTPNEEVLRALPQWARVAFAARCAQRARAVYIQYARGNQASPGQVAAIDAALALAFATARSGNHPSSTRDAAESAYLTRDSQARAAAYAAVCAPFAADPRVAADTADSFARAYSRDVLDQNALAVESAWKDYDKLIEESRREGWTDESPVDPDRLGPLWPNGAPKLARSAVDEPVMLLEVVTAGDTDPEIHDERIARLLGYLSRMHVDFGGSGLALASDQGMAYEPVPVLQPLDGGGAR